jgi:hypothetical protein
VIGYRLHGTEAIVKPIKKITIKIFKDGVCKTHVKHAPPKKAFNTDSIDILLCSVAENLEKQHPDYEFRLVELPGHTFNLIGSKKEVVDAA